MQGLSPSVDLQPIVGAKVSQVCFSTFQCIFGFDIDARVAVESSCQYTAPSGATVTVTEYPRAATELCELLDTSVLAAAREPEGGLTLRFSNEATLKILNDNRDFESFQVHIGKVVHVA